MAYSTYNDMLGMIDEAELIQATDDKGTGVVDQGHVTAAITAADSEIDGYLAGRYTLPLDPVPAVLKTFSVDMAIYHVLSRRLGAPDGRKDRYKNAVAFFKSVAKGEVKLGVDDPDGSGGSDTPEFDGPDRIFSRESMAGF
jgi:phage gp36-like protein